MQPLLIKPLSK